MPQQINTDKLLQDIIQTIEKLALLTIIKTKDAVGDGEIVVQCERKQRHSHGLSMSCRKTVCDFKHSCHTFHYAAAEIDSISTVSPATYCLIKCGLYAEGVVSALWLLSFNGKIFFFFLNIAIDCS